jgi:DUF4097 and DUF4098 domain-containing protein YvlB
MKKLGVLFLLMLFAVSVQAQESEERNVGSFTGIKVSEGIDVYLKKGDREGVRVEVSGTRLDNVLTEVSGSYLKVHLRSGNIRGKVNIRVYVTYSKLEKLYASSAGNIFSDGGLRTEDLVLQCSSAGNIEIEVDARNIEASASSAGQIELRGRTKSFEADASSAGQINAYELDSDAANVSASSAGQIRLSVESSLRADASSGGSIRFRGNPSRSITNSSSGGSVKKSN